MCIRDRVVLTDIVTCEEDSRVLLVVYEPSERVAEAFDNGACTAVDTTDTCYNNYLTLFAQSIGNSLKMCIRDSS